MTSADIGLRESDYGRFGNVALYDHIVGLLQDKIPVIRTVYGDKVSSVEPFIAASFVKKDRTLPAISMSIISGAQFEVGIGQVPLVGEVLRKGMHNVSMVQLDIWARNRNELETVSNAVIATLQKYRTILQQKGIHDMKFFKTYERGYDPNTANVWFGFTQAIGEIWLKALEYTVWWDHIWEPDGYEGGSIKKIEIIKTVDGATLEDSIGLSIQGLFDTMFLERNVGKRINLLGGRTR